MRGALLSVSIKCSLEKVPNAMDGNTGHSKNRTKRKMETNAEDINNNGPRGIVLSTIMVAAFNYVVFILDLCGCIYVKFGNQGRFMVKGGGLL